MDIMKTNFTPLSPGKRRGLLVTSDRNHNFSILAIDHGIDMKVTIRPADPTSVSYDEIVGVKSQLIKHLSSAVSALLLDPVFALAPAVMQDALPGHIGLLMCIEDGDYASPAQPSRAIAGWSVEQIKRAGGAAVKVYCHYHPDDRKMAQAQEEFITKLVSACAEYDLPLFAEPISYGVSGAERRRVVVESGRRFSQLGIDILKAEFPLDIVEEQDEEVWQEACRELSNAIAVPWVLLSAGVDFPTFARQLRAACRGGASGYLAGRAIWKEGMTLNESGQAQFLRDTAVPRLAQLNEIVEQYASPWTSIYAAQPVEQDWYKKI